MNVELLIYKDIESFKKDEKSRAWSKNIYNTNKDVFGLYTKEINDIIKKYQNENIGELKERNLYELNLIYIKIKLKQCKNLAEQEDFLRNNVDLIDSWAITDTSYQLLRIKSFDEALIFFEEFSSIDNEMLIRYAFLVFFKFKEDRTCYEKILPRFKNSKYYYVNMVEAWLLATLYIFFPEETYNFLETSNISNDIKLKSISKICDSFRIDNTEKEKVRLLRKNIRNSEK